MPLSGRTAGSTPSCDSFPIRRGLQAAQGTAWQASAGTNFLSNDWDETGQEGESVQLGEEQGAWHTMTAPAGTGWCASLGFFTGPNFVLCQDVAQQHWLPLRSHPFTSKSLHRPHAWAIFCFPAKACL